MEHQKCHLGTVACKEDVGKGIGYGKLSISYTVEAVIRPNVFFDSYYNSVCSVFLM